MCWIQQPHLQTLQLALPTLHVFPIFTGVGDILDGDLHVVVIAFVTRILTADAAILVVVFPIKPMGFREKGEAPFQTFGVQCGGLALAGFDADFERGFDLLSRFVEEARDGERRFPRSDVLEDGPLVLHGEDFDMFR